MWLRLHGKGHDVARCTIERLFPELGITGVTRAKGPRTTIPENKADRPTDLVDRQFVANQPNRLWVADFTHVSTWECMVYAAFIIDVFSRRTIGWRAATSMTTPLVLDALEMAIWTRRKDGVTDLSGLVHHTDAGSNTPRSRLPNASSRRALTPRLGRSATPTTLRLNLRWASTRAS